jgi:hypothetical protein
MHTCRPQVYRTLTAHRYRYRQLLLEKHYQVSVGDSVHDMSGTHTGITGGRPRLPVPCICGGDAVYPFEAIALPS